MHVTFKTYQTEIKSDGEADSRRMHFLISTDAVDRDNDILDPKGWQLDRYKSNPIVAFAHDYKALPVAKCIAIAQTAKGLEATAEFPEKGVYPFADTVYDMLKGGFLNATSVGFRPIDYEQAHDRKGYNFKTQELTEFSIVPIPSNPEALIQQRSGGGDEQTRTWCKAITAWAEQVRPSADAAIQAWANQHSLTLAYDLNDPVFAEFEKDYLIESADGTKAIPDARLEKLLKINGLLTEQTKEGKDANLKAAHASAMDAYANAHHAETIMQEMCGMPEMKSLSGGHMEKAKEAQGAISRAKGHAMTAAQHLAEGHDEKAAAEAIQKAAEVAAAAKAEAPFLTLLDDDPNVIRVSDETMKDVLASLGPELAELIAGQTRTTLNQMLGRID